VESAAGSVKKRGEQVQKIGDGNVEAGGISLACHLQSVIHKLFAGISTSSFVEAALQVKET
jgi:hypothetical protein